MKDRIIAALTKWAPLELADASFDNVGLLVDSLNSVHYQPLGKYKVFLCNDFTEEVADEAISKKINMVVAYHPPIFASIKRLVASDIKQRILLKAISSNICIFSPHTVHNN